MPTEPTLILEIEFDEGVWTDVAADIRSGNTNRGKDRALDKVDPGTMTIVLKNNGRTYDPEYADGPHFGKLIPGKGIRFKATWDGSTEDIFTGSISAIYQDYEPPNTAVAIIEAVDDMAKLASAFLQTPLELAMSLQSPHAWLRLNERNGPYAHDRMGLWHGVYVGDPSFGDMVTFTEPTDYVQVAPGTLPTVPPWSISFKVYIPDITGTYYIMWDANFPNGFKMFVDYPDGRLNVHTGGGSFVRSGSILYNVYQITIIAQAGNRLGIYIGDQEVATLFSGTTAAAHTIPPGYHVWGAHNLILNSTEISFGEIMVFNYALSAADLYDLEQAQGGWLMDAGDARVDRVLDYAGWPSADRSITGDFDTYLGATELQTSALEHLRQIESTIEGRLWVLKDGRLRLLGRKDHIEGYYATSQATFGDAPGEHGYTSMGRSGLDMELVTNVVRRHNGDTVVIGFDPDSIEEFGRRDESEAADVDSLYMTTEDEYDLAMWRVGRYGRPLPHIPNLKIKPRSDPDNLWPQVLQRELADRITHVRRPQSIGNPIERDVIIEGISHTFGPKKWETTFSIDAIGARDYFAFDHTEWDEDDWRFSA